MKVAYLVSALGTGATVLGGVGVYLDWLNAIRGNSALGIVKQYLALQPAEVLFFVPAMLALTFLLGWVSRGILEKRRLEKVLTEFHSSLEVLRKSFASTKEVFQQNSSYGQLTINLDRTMFEMSDRIASLATTIFGSTCGAGIYLIHRGDKLWRAYRDTKTRDQIKNDKHDVIVFGTTMKKIVELDGRGKPICVLNNISKTLADYVDPTSEKIDGIYDSAMAVAIRVRNRQKESDAPADETKANRQLMVGFIQVETPRKSIKDKALEQAICGIADTMFSTLYTYSLAARELPEVSECIFTAELHEAIEHQIAAE